jgi:hypothetical protein
MGILTTLSRPGAKDSEKSIYDQATFEFATASNSQKLVNRTEAVHDQVASELTSSDDSPELVDITEADDSRVTSDSVPSYDYQEFANEAEAEFDQIVSDLYQQAEDQCSQMIETIKSEAENDQATSDLTSSDDSPEPVDGTKAENDQMTPEFAPFFDCRDLVHGTQAEFEQIISDLYNRAKDQCNEIGAIIKSESEYGRATSEFAASCDYKELVDGTEADFDRVISDLYHKAKDQCYQIISTIKKAFEADLEYADALCDLKIAYEDVGECDSTKLQKKDKQIKTIKHFRLHIDTCDIYAIEQRADATLVGSCGPLAEDDLKDLNSYEYTDKQNAWIQNNLNKLILWFP